MRNRRSFVAFLAGLILGAGAATGYAATTATCTDAASCFDGIIALAQQGKSSLSTTTVPGSTTTAAPTTTASTSTSTSTTTTIPPTGINPPNIPGAWALTFHDEFDGTTLNRALWNTSGSWECCNGGRSNPGNGELDYKTDGQNFTIANGTLTIQARRESFNGSAWTSGQLGSTKAFNYAYIENRVKMASPKGFLNALWTWGAPGTNAPQQETDVFEFYSDNHSQLAVTSHASGGGGCGFIQLGFDPTLAFHTYGADIQPSGTDWYIDGVKRCHAAGHPTQPWNIVDYMTVNASSRAPVADPSTTHAEYTIDYERAWQH